MPLTSITSKTTMYNNKKDTAKGAAAGAAKGGAAGKSTAKGKRVLKDAPKKDSAKKRSPEFLKRMEGLRKRAASKKNKTK